MTRPSRQFDVPRLLIAAAATVAGALALLGRGEPVRAEAPDPAGVEFFERKIRPLLVERCYECHSAAADGEEPQAELRLDSRDGLLKGGVSGPSVVAGEPDKSLLIEAVRYRNDKLQMPPDERLTDAQIADLEAWVKMGAPDPRGGVAAPAPPSTNPTEWAKLAEGRTWWAFQRPIDQAPLAVKDGAWARDDIDRFILAKLEAKGLRPAPPADRRTLIRRAYFDLLGLPPPAEEVEAFVNDASPDAYARLVDRLLASPQYGQRWARHWLDVVRYTDSFDSRIVGGEPDCAFAWRYRDWVVDSFNRDLPYDRFVTEQVAGDLTPSRDGEPFNRDGIVATGVYMIGEWGGGDADKDKLISDVVDDQVDLTGRAFMGLTVSCARCHDHKFDPISTKDYYGLAGIFYSSRILADPGPKGGSPVNVRTPLLSERELAQRKADEARVAQLGTEIDGILDRAYAALASDVLARADAYLAAAWEYGQFPADAGAPRPPLAKFAADRDLNPYAVSQWVGQLAGPQLKTLAQPVRNLADKPGLFVWRNPAGPDTPIVVVNTTATPTETLPGLTFPARSVCMHPSPGAGVAVSWRSPITGRVRVTGAVVDGHAAGGDGVAWSLSRVGGAAAGELASGTIANGGRQALAEGTGGDALGSVEVRAGESIQLAVLPKVEYTCDTTHVELEIADVGNGAQTWKLADDAVASVNAAASNPLPDANGRAGVWTFHDLAGQAPTLFAAGSPLSAFVTRVAGTSDPTAIKSAADDAIKSLRDEDRRALTDPRGSFWSTARGDDSNLPEAVRQELRAKRAEAKKLNDALAEPVPLAHALQEGGTPNSLFPSVQDVPVHVRGRYDRLGEVVPRRMPVVLAGESQPPIQQGSGRRELARWLASADHPLTARVMVNRIWQDHFGDGIVRTPNNFGKLGSPPTHPELLDHLAVRFEKSGWSVKAMHRALMLSATYMQSSHAAPETVRADPANELLGRMSRRKLEAEALRDAMLAVAGTLDPSAGGVAVNDLNTPRRSLYVMTIRSIRNDYRALFDAADASAIVEKRNDSIVAPQALFLMNHPFVVERSRQLAERMERATAGGDDAAKVDWLYRTMFGRPPTAGELTIGGKLVGKQGWQAYCHVLLCSNEFMYVD